jgi:purine-cytosine permease-like protein
MSRLDEKMGVESQGIDRVAEEKKEPPSIWNVSLIVHQSLRISPLILVQIFLMWWSLNVHVGVVPLGILGPEFGLSLNQTIAATIAGTLLGSLCTAYTGTLGPKLGLRQIACSRFSFGFYGAKLCSGLNVIVGGGFAVVNYVRVSSLCA